MGRAKLKVGVFSFTSCSGCQLILINSDRFFGDLSKYIEIIHLPIIQEHNGEGPYDISFIEGAITKESQIEKLKYIRENSKYLISFGTCATFGGVSAIREIKKNFKENKIYKDFEFLNVLGVNDIASYVKVDYFIRGCPPTEKEIINLIETLYNLGELPKPVDNPVCVECRAKKNPCLLAKKKQCLGPVTFGGCDALCTSQGISCYGCRGPVSSPNVDRLVKLFKTQGIDDEHIKLMFMTFAGTSKGYSDYFDKVNG